MESDQLLGAAVHNNALWCDAVCGSHGHPGAFGRRLWVSLGHDVPFYPHVITLTADADLSEIETETGVEPAARPYAVKDSFARLDLTSAGLEPLLEGEWIVHSPTRSEPDDFDLRWTGVATAGELRRWERAWARDAPVDRPVFLPKLLDDARCAILSARGGGQLVAGVIAFAAADVIGLSNLWAGASLLSSWQLWTSAVRAAAARRPHLPVVGYEHGIELGTAQQAGARPLGPLRVWAR